MADHEVVHLTGEGSLSDECDENVLEPEHGLAGPFRKIDAEGMNVAKSPSQSGEVEEMRRCRKARLKENVRV